MLNTQTCIFFNNNGSGLLLECITQAINTAWRSSGVAITKCICSESDPGIKKVSRSIEPLTRLFAQMCFEGPYRNVHSFIQKLVAYRIPPCTPSPLQQMLKFKRAYTTCYTL